MFACMYYVTVTVTYIQHFFIKIKQEDEIKAERIAADKLAAEKAAEKKAAETEAAAKAASDKG